MVDRGTVRFENKEARSFEAAAEAIRDLCSALDELEEDDPQWMTAIRQEKYQTAFGALKDITFGLVRRLGVSSRNAGAVVLEALDDAWWVMRSPEIDTRKALQILCSSVERHQFADTRLRGAQPRPEELSLQAQIARAETRAAKNFERFIEGD